MKDRVDLRMTRFDSGCTVLWSNAGCFVEQYLAINILHRDRLGLSAYEMEIEPDGELGESFRPGASLGHTGFFEHYSEPYHQWWDRRDHLVSAAESSINRMKSRAELNAEEASVLTKFFKELHRLFWDQNRN